MLAKTESTEPRSTIYTKTMSTFVPHIGAEAAARLAEKIEVDVKKIKEGIGNPMILLRDLGSVVHKIKENLGYQELINSLNELRDLLVELLTQYTTNTEATRIAEAAILKVRAEHKPGESFLTIDRNIAQWAREQLNALTDRKKLIDPIIFGSDFSKILRLFKKRIDEKYEDMDAEIFNELEASISPERMKEMEEQGDAGEEIEEEISELIRKAIEPIKTLYVQLYLSSQKLVLTEAAIKGMSRSEAMDYGMKELPKKMEPINIKIEALMDCVVSAWSKDKPIDVVNTLDFHGIKTRVKLELNLDRAIHTIEQAVTALNTRTTPATLSEEELTSARKKFTRFLHEIRENNLTILFEEKLQDIDVKNLHLVDAKDNFRTLIRSLSKECQAILTDNKCTSEQIDTLNLSEWQPTPSILSLLSDSSLITKVVEYSRCYTAECQRLAEEKRQAEVAAQRLQLQKVGAGPSDPKRVQLLVDTIRNSIKPMFKLFVTKSSLATLQTVLDTVSKSEFVSKSSDVSAELISDLKRSMGELRQASYSSLSSSSSSSSSSLMFSCAPEVQLINTTTLVVKPLTVDLNSSAETTEKAEKAKASFTI